MLVKLGQPAIPFRFLCWNLVLVAELTQTMCDAYGGDLPLTTGVCIECSHPVILIAKCKTIGVV